MESNTNDTATVTQNIFDILKGAYTEEEAKRDEETLAAILQQRFGKDAGDDSKSGSSQVL